MSSSWSLFHVFPCLAISILLSCWILYKIACLGLLKTQTGNIRGEVMHLLCVHGFEYDHDIWSTSAFSLDLEIICWSMEFVLFMMLSAESSLLSLKPQILMFRSFESSKKTCIYWRRQWFSTRQRWDYFFPTGMTGVNPVS